MAIASKGLRSKFNRLILGAAVLLCIVLALMSAGHDFSLGAYLTPVYVAFLLAFLIFGQRLNFGFGGPRASIAGSYAIALLCLLVAVYVLWYATDPAVAAGLKA